MSLALFYTVLVKVAKLIETSLLWIYKIELEMMEAWPVFACFPHIEVQKERYAIEALYEGCEYGFSATKGTVTRVLC